MQNKRLTAILIAIPVAIIGVMIAIALKPIDIVRSTFSNEYKQQTLYRGETKVNWSFGYNQYAVYDGKNVTIILSRVPAGASFTFKVGDKLSEPFNDKYNSIPMELGLKEGDVITGTLIDKDNKEYEVTVEFPFDVEQNTLHGEEVTTESSTEAEAPLILSPEQEEWNANSDNR